MTFRTLLAVLSIGACSDPAPIAPSSESTAAPSLTPASTPSVPAASEQMRVSLEMVFPEERIETGLILLDDGRLQVHEHGENFGFGRLAGGQITLQAEPGGESSAGLRREGARFVDSHDYLESNIDPQGVANVADFRYRIDEDGTIQFLSLPEDIPTSYMGRWRGQVRPAPSSQEAHDTALLLVAQMLN